MGRFWRGSGEVPERFWGGSGQVLQGSGEVLERVWRGSGEVPERFRRGSGEVLGRFWEVLERFWRSFRNVRNCAKVLGVPETFLEVLEMFEQLLSSTAKFFCAAITNSLVLRNGLASKPFTRGLDWGLRNKFWIWGNILNKNIKSKLVVFQNMVDGKMSRMSRTCSSTYLEIDRDCLRTDGSVNSYSAGWIDVPISRN